MAAVPTPRPNLYNRTSTARRSGVPLHLIKGSFSTKRVSRKSPLVGSIHRAVDGALFAVLIIASLMSALTLHWQYLWTITFKRLESTKDLVQGLNESTFLLERHILDKANLPNSMVPTKASNLIYMSKSYKSSYENYNDNRGLVRVKRIINYPVHHGY